MPKRPTVYIQTDKPNGTLYTGVTAYPRARNNQHKTGKGGTFTSKYNLTLLVWFEEHPDMPSAILREKQLKNWRREQKIKLIEKANPEWADLTDQLPYND